MDIVVVIITVLVGVIGFLISILLAYNNTIKNKKTYSRNKAYNGDIHLDDVCDRYLILTNIHVPSGDK